MRKISSSTCNQVFFSFYVALLPSLVRLAPRHFAERQLADTAIWPKQTKLVSLRWVILKFYGLGSLLLVIATKELVGQMAVGQMAVCQIVVIQFTFG